LLGSNAEQLSDPSSNSAATIAKGLRISRKRLESDSSPVLYSTRERRLSPLGPIAGRSRLTPCLRNSRRVALRIESWFRPRREA
jgi:hypothetical protein